MSWRSRLWRFVLLGGAVWLIGFGVSAQEPGFFAGNAAVGLTAEQAEKPNRAIHFNAMQPWRVARDGSVQDAMFS